MSERQSTPCRPRSRAAYRRGPSGSSEGRSKAKAKARSKAEAEAESRTGDRTGGSQFVSRSWSPFHSKVKQPSLTPPQAPQAPRVFNMSSGPSTPLGVDILYVNFYEGRIDALQQHVSRQSEKLTEQQQAIAQLIYVMNNGDIANEIAHPSPLNKYTNDEQPRSNSNEHPRNTNAPARVENRKSLPSLGSEQNPESLKVWMAV